MLLLCGEGTPMSNLISRRLEPLLRDPRDMPFIPLQLQITLTVVPLAVYLFLPGRFNWWLGSLYLVLVILVFPDRFVFMNHNTAHNPLWRRRLQFMNYYNSLFLAWFFGITPGYYYAHHILMHHPENNVEPDDVSSTMHYRRDSFSDFLKYFLHFIAIGWWDTAAYHWKKGKKKPIAYLAAGEAGIVFGAAALTWLNWRAGLVVAVIPSLLMHFGMMVGNWGNHAFIDPRDPGNLYRSSVNIINTHHNVRNFNDGYHIIHHIKPQLHWADAPGEFEKNLARYVAEDAIVFEKINYLVLWFFLMCGRYDKLARYYVRLPGAPPRTDEEVMELLRERVRPIGLEVAAASA
jgi:hypothetical protein